MGALLSKAKDNEVKELLQLVAFSVGFYSLLSPPPASCPRLDAALQRLMTGNLTLQAATSSSTSSGPLSDPEGEWLLGLARALQSSLKPKAQSPLPRGLAQLVQAVVLSPRAQVTSAGHRTGPKREHLRHEERITRLAIWSHELLAPLLQDHYCVFTTLRELGVEIFGELWPKGPAMMPHHLLVTVQTENGGWHLLRKDVEGVHWHVASADDKGASLPIGLICTLESSLKVTCHLLDTFVFASGSGWTRELDLEGMACTEIVPCARPTVGEILDFADERSSPMGQVPYIGPQALALLLGVPLVGEADVQQAINTYFANMDSSIVQGLALDLFGLSIQVEDYWNEKGFITELPRQLGTA